MTAVRWVGAFLAAISLLTPIAGLSLASDTSVSYACNPGRTSSTGHWFDGWQKNLFGATAGGLYARIENVDVYVQPGAVGTTAWVMLTNASASQWSQVGWIDHANGNRNSFLQIYNSSSDIVTRVTLDPAQTLGTKPYYTALYNNTPGKFTFQVNGSAFPSVGWNYTAGFTPTVGEIYGETQNYNSQMPGAQTNDVDMLDAHIYTNGTWATFSGTATSSDSSIWKYFGPVAGVDLYIWDHACQTNG